MDRYSPKMALLDEEAKPELRTRPKNRTSPAVAPPHAQR